MATDAERISHLIDDMETVRTHPIRTIQNLIPLLSDAATALDQGHLDVVAEYLDRVRTALAKEDRWLRSAEQLRPTGD